MTLGVAKSLTRSAVRSTRARPRSAEALKDRFTFKTEMDDDARKQMFPQNARLAAR